jgi:hypothetical protein
MASRGIKCILFTGCVVALASLSSLAADSPSTITLAWDPSPSGEIAGYRLYSGTATRAYVSILDVGSTTTGALTNLTPGMTYYAAVTAYDLFGLESAFSDEISFLVPGGATTPTTLQIVLDRGKQVILSGAAQPGHSYDVLSTDGLSNWTMIGTLTADAQGNFRFADSHLATNAMTLYRLRLHSP